MTELSKLVITETGQALMAKAIANEDTIKFTKVKTSSHAYTVDDLEPLSDLEDIEQTTDVSKITITNNVSVKVEAAISNVELTTGYNFRAVGLYADDSGKDVLYAAAVELSGNCVMPAYNNVTVSAIYLQLYTTIGNADNVSLDVDSGAYATVGDVLSLEQDISDIMAYIGYPDESEIYGVEVDFANQTFTRLSGAVGKEGGADFDGINAFGGRKRCILADDGTVLAYYGDAAFTTSGALTQAVAIGTSSYPVGTVCQVMVEQPAFYYKVVPLVREGQDLVKARYYVSDKPVNGFKLHPAFIEDNNQNDKIYLSAFEGCLQVGNTYQLNNEQVLNTASDKLSSIAGAYPVTGTGLDGSTQNFYRSAARLTAENRGKGWEEIYAATVAASQLLMLIEYGTFNLQLAIGNGAVSKSDDGSSYLADPTGTTESLGNVTGTATNANGVQFISYRGEENFWGNVWKWVDGMNIKNPADWGGSSDPGSTSNFGNLYVADHDFADDTDADPYVDTGICPRFMNGYISRFGYNEDFDYLFIPTKAGGNSALPIGDYCWNYNNNWRVAGVGARWSSSSGAGAFALTLALTSSGRFRTCGGRLVYVPSKNT